MYFSIIGSRVEAEFYFEYLKVYFEYSKIYFEYLKFTLKIEYLFF